MPNRYHGLSAEEADRLMQDTIATVIRDEMTGVAFWKPEDWMHRDVSEWADRIAGTVRTCIEVRRMGAPCASPRLP